MAEKVKVSREVAEAIEWGLSRGAADTFLIEHGNNWKNGSFIEYCASHEEMWALSKVTVFQLAEILLNGYEIEQTPEEKLLATYERQIAWADTNDIFDKRAHTAYANAIIHTLDTLGIKIEGINK